MKVQDALSITDAFAKIATFMGLEVLAVMQRVVFMDEGLAEKLKEPIKITNNFYHSNTVERGKMLGLTITEHEPGEAIDEAEKAGLF